MPQRKVIMVGMVVGGVIGSYVPVLLGAGPISFASLIGGGIGSVVGIYFAYRLMQ